MNTIMISAVRKISACFFTIILSVAFSTQAHAVVINFDDLTYVPLDPESPSFGDFPLNTQYQSQGLVISNAYLLPYGSEEEIISGSNYLLAGASGSSMTLSFVGDLPTYVGMYIDSAQLGILYTNAYGPSGFFASHQKLDSDWEYVFFESATGIAQIEMWATQQHRVSGGAIDDITYTYASVPETSSLGLSILAILILFSRRFRWWPKG